MTENVDLTFLAKQNERILGEMAGISAEIGEVRGEMGGMRVEMAGMRADISDLKATQKQQGEVLVKVIDAVTALATRQEQQSLVIGKIHEGQQIIERDLSAIKMRVERIERHTGLVQA